MQVPLGFATSIKSSGEPISECQNHCGLILRTKNLHADELGLSETSQCLPDRLTFRLQIEESGADINNFDIKSGIEVGREGGPRPPDEDRLELHQAFNES